MGLLLCFVAFLGTYLAGRRSLGHGFGAVLTVGYGYGALRARFLDGFSHFAFDLSVVALYLACFAKPASPLLRRETHWASQWMWLLVGWPVLWFFVPLQHPLIQLVGLRSAVFFLPLLLVGARAEEEDVTTISRYFMGLNFVALGFGIAEYFWGIEWLFPLNPVTEIMYMSADVASGGEYFLRIPSTFPNAHAYGNTMTASIPFLLGRLTSAQSQRGERYLLAGAVVAAGVGAFLCGARQVVVQLGLLMLIFIGGSRPGARTFFPVAILTLVVGLVVAENERLQRFLTLTDMDVVTQRLQVSANLSTLELLVNYPLGAGLGSAFGTTIPFFLSSLAPEQIGAENEYARMVLEQSPMGVIILLAFLGALLLRRPQVAVSRSRALALCVWAYVATAWGTAFIGNGITTSIPTTAALFVMMGLLARRRNAVPARAAADDSLRPAQVESGVPIVRPTHVGAPSSLGTARP